MIKEPNENVEDRVESSERNLPVSHPLIHQKVYKSADHAKISTFGRLQHVKHVKHTSNTAQ